MNKKIIFGAAVVLASFTNMAYGVQLKSTVEVQECPCNRGGYDRRVMAQRSIGYGSMPDYERTVYRLGRSSRSSEETEEEEEPVAQ